MLQPSAGRAAGKQRRAGGGGGKDQSLPMQPAGAPSRFRGVSGVSARGIRPIKLYKIASFPAKRVGECGPGAASGHTWCPPEAWSGLGTEREQQRAPRWTICAVRETSGRDLTCQPGQAWMGSPRVVKQMASRVLLQKRHCQPSVCVLCVRAVRAVRAVQFTHLPDTYNPTSCSYSHIHTQTIHRAAIVQPIHEFLPGRPGGVQQELWPVCAGIVGSRRRNSQPEGVCELAVTALGSTLQSPCGTCFGMSAALNADKIA